MYTASYDVKISQLAEVKQLRLKQITKRCYPNFFWGRGVGLQPPQPFPWIRFYLRNNISGKFSSQRKIKVARPALFNEKTEKDF